MIFRASIDAFTLTAAVTETLDRLKGEHAFAMARIAVREGGLAAAAAAYSNRPSPQVLIVEDSCDETLSQRLDRLAECCDPGTRVIVIGTVNDIQFYRQLVAKGVSEYLVAPVRAADLAAAIGALFHDPSAAPRGKVVAFWGARGGAGASTLSQNVADAIGRACGEAAIYVDLDLAFGTSLLAFNMEARQTIDEALAAPERLDPVLLDRMLVQQGEALRVLAAPADPARGRIASLDGIDRLIDLASRMSPALVLDLPRLWCEWTEHVLTGADEMVIVAQPDLASLREAKRLLELVAVRRAREGGVRIVINKLDAYRKTQLSPKDFAETLGVEPALVLPFEPVLFGEAANNGQMLSANAKGHRIVHQIAAFAERLSGRPPARPAKGNPLLRLISSR